MEKKVIIYRGAPGSGKSTDAAKFLGEAMNDPAYYKRSAIVVSADHHFMVDGEYRFDPKGLDMAHRSCLRKFIDQLNDGVDLVIVDNTNTQTWEMAPYYAVARAFDYAVEIREVVCPPETAGARNIHGVPVAKVKQMAERFQKVPQNWKATVVQVVTG